MEAIKADLIEPAAVTVDFSFTPVGKSRRARTLVLRPWTILNEVEACRDQGGGHALSVAIMNAGDNPEPMFRFFCSQLEPESAAWLAETFGASAEPGDLSAVMVAKLSTSGTKSVCDALVAAHTQGMPAPEKKSLTQLIRAYPICSTSTVFAFGLCVGSQLLVLSAYLAP